MASKRKPKIPMTVDALMKPDPNPTIADLLSRDQPKPKKQSRKTREAWERLENAEPGRGVFGRVRGGDDGQN